MDTGMRHLLLLLPFLLFDLLHDEVHDHNSLHGTSYESPATDLIAWVIMGVASGSAGVVSPVQVLQFAVSLIM